MKYIDNWKLHRACLDRRLSLRAVAERAGIRPDRVYRLSGGYLPPRPDELQRLAEVLRVEPSELLRDSHWSEHHG